MERRGRQSAGNGEKRMKRRRSLSNYSKERDRIKQLLQKTVISQELGQSDIQSKLTRGNLPSNKASVHDNFASQSMLCDTVFGNDDSTGQNLFPKDFKPRNRSFERKHFANTVTCPSQIGDFRNYTVQEGNKSECANYEGNMIQKPYFRIQKMAKSTGFENSKGLKFPNQVNPKNHRKSFIKQTNKYFQKPYKENNQNTQNTKEQSKQRPPNKKKERTQKTASKNASKSDKTRITKILKDKAKLEQELNFLKQYFEREQRMKSDYQKELNEIVSHNQKLEIRVQKFSLRNEILELELSKSLNLLKKLGSGRKERNTRVEARIAKEKWAVEHLCMFGLYSKETKAGRKQQGIIRSNTGVYQEVNRSQTEHMDSGNYEPIQKCHTQILKRTDENSLTGHTLWNKDACDLLSDEGGGNKIRTMTFASNQLDPKKLEKSSKNVCTKESHIEEIKSPKKRRFVRSTRGSSLDKFKKYQNDLMNSTQKENCQQIEIKKEEAATAREVKIIRRKRDSLEQQNSKKFLKSNVQIEAEIVEQVLKEETTNTDSVESDSLEKKLKILKERRQRRRLRDSFGSKTSEPVIQNKDREDHNLKESIPEHMQTGQVLGRVYEESDIYRYLFIYSFIIY